LKTKVGKETEKNYQPIKKQPHLGDEAVFLI
jgi:hypothetical protein